MHSDESYYNTIDRCAINKTDLEISNSAPGHAAYLLKKMFNHANNEVCIYTENLNEDVFGDQDLINAALAFLGKGEDKAIRIAYEKKIDQTYLENPFINALSANDIIGTLELWATNDRYKDTVNHFAVMDRQAFRYEIDHKQKKALANFGDQESANDLRDMFSKILETAKPVHH